MEITEIKNDIKTKSFKSFYIFSGPEWRVQRIYIDHLAQASGKELRYIDSFMDIYGKLKTNSFAAKSYLYVVRDDKELMSNEKVQAQLTDMLKSNILILLITAVDKRLKFYKTYKDIICEFEPLKPAVLTKYIQKEIALSDENCEKLMELCEYDYGRCLLEANKIKCFDSEAVNSAFDHLLKSGGIYTPPKDAIFDFVDAILDNKLKLSYQLYQDCLGVGEATMVMISVLYNNARAVLQVQECTSKDVAKSTGLTGWQIMNAKKHTGKRRTSELLRIMKICQKCQKAIVTGTMDEEFVMDRILVEAFS